MYQLAWLIVSFAPTSNSHTHHQWVHKVEVASFKSKPPTCASVCPSCFNSFYFRARTIRTLGGSANGQGESCGIWVPYTVTVVTTFPPMVTIPFSLITNPSTQSDASAGHAAPIICQASSWSGPYNVTTPSRPMCKNAFLHSAWKASKPQRLNHTPGLTTWPTGMGDDT